MTTEEKAKAYDEALETARRINSGEGVAAPSDWTICEVIFPKLKENENEDERIRKDLIKYLESDRDCQPCQDVSFYDSSIAWLEKQKENSKSADSIPSNCASDAKCENEHNEEGDFVFELRQIIGSHRYSDIYGEYTNDEEGMASEILELCKCELEKRKEQPQEELVYRLNGLMQEYIKEGEDDAEKEHRLKCYQLFWDALEDADFFEQKEQKPAEWSEEDEKKRSLLIDILEVNHPNGYFKVNPANTLNMEAMSVKELVDWLKSLRFPLHLKPNDVQILYKEMCRGIEHSLATEFMNYLDNNKPEGKMCLSNGECEDIEKAFKENDWAKIIRYAKKYQIQSEQKPEVKLTGWVARDGDGDIYVYEDYPGKDSKEQFWFGMGSSSRILDQKSFPDLKWEEGPVEVEITIRKK